MRVSPFRKLASAAVGYAIVLLLKLSERIEAGHMDANLIRADVEQSVLLEEVAKRLGWKPGSDENPVYFLLHRGSR